MISSLLRVARKVIPLVLLTLLGACGGGGGSGGGAPHSVGGTVSGLAGAGLKLLDNGADSLSVPASGPFTFATTVSGGASYNVTVSSQPTNPSQTCTVAHGSGTISGSDVTNVAVTCTTNTYTIGGAVSGLTGTGLVLALNGTNNPAISTAGAYTLAPAVESGSTYAVTVVTQPTNPPQTCTIASGSGTVQSGNVTNVAVTCTTNTYSVGGYVSGLVGSGLTLSYSGGAPIPVARNGYYSAATGVAIGANYSVTIASQPTNPGQVCVVSNGTGTIGTTNVNAANVFCPQSVGRFAYVVGAGITSTPSPNPPPTPGTISVYSIDPATGALTLVPGSAVSTGPEVSSFQFIPYSNFAWAVEPGESLVGIPSSIYDYSVDPTTGLLTPVTGSPFLGLAGTATTPGCLFGGYGYTRSVTLAPSGTFGYANNTGHNGSYNAGTWTFTVDPTTGAPTLVAGSQNPQCLDDPVVVDPSGQFAYINAAIGMYAFNIDASTHAMSLVPGSPFSAGTTPLVMDPAGHFAYEPNDRIYVLQVDPTTGALSQIPGSPFSSGADVIAIEPRGKFAYVHLASGGSGPGIYTYSIDATTGALAPVVADAPVLLTSQVRPNPIIDPSGKFLFTVADVGANQRGVYVYSIDPATGALSAVPGSPFDVTNIGVVGLPDLVTVRN